MPRAIDGIIDTSNWDFEADGILKLNGDWSFYWQRLLEPADFVGENDQRGDWISIPADWTTHQHEGVALPSKGYATLRLTITVDDLEQVYGLKFRYFASAMNLWINGNLAHSSGLVAESADDYIGRYIPAEVFFITDTHEIDIIVQVANYHHRRVKLNEVFFGTQEQIHTMTYREVIKSSIIFGSLMLIAVYYLILYFIQRRDKAALYIAVFAFIVALRNAVMGDRILSRLLPELPPELFTKIGYLPVFILLPLVILYVREIFYSPTLDKAAHISKYVVVALTALIFITSVSFYDWLFQYALMLILLAALFMIYILITEGFFKKIRGAWIMAVGSGVILVAALNDYLSDLHVIRSVEMLSIAVLIFVLLQAIFLAWRFNDAYIRATKLATENAVMYEELQELNEQLEVKVKDRTLELEIANMRLEQLSKIDPLTSIANRRLFDERLNEEWRRALREQTPISIIMLDIDCFKEYNDNYGHLQGDTTLQQIAAALTDVVKRSTDFVARFGGEEFVVLLANTEEEGALYKAEVIRKAIEDLRIGHEYSRVGSYCTVSLGVNTQIVKESDNAEDFIRKADKALYNAKQTGRNKVVHITAVNK
ncbi:hypothetical protein BHF68_04400 [Desulfuribacillus alkaliarsenatis]|uniref:GGDEF domain-containing protein n=1 Tax=Desulfuribacillus alkaliarsenatis TaxID=766136 RepID=A0A1E5G3C7_9FIRM|nr:hypothetical protein BHF68_04400 [Desulfuribacillus alkaliarsenatis]